MTDSTGSDFTAIEALAQTYFDALYEGDVDKFAGIFHPQARLFSVGGGETVILDVPTYLSIVGGRESPAQRGDHREDILLSIDRPTPSTGHIRVCELFLPKRFTDELTLMKCDGKWSIVSKVWDFEILDEKA